MPRTAGVRSSTGGGEPKTIKALRPCRPESEPRAIRAGHFSLSWLVGAAGTVPGLAAGGLYGEDVDDREGGGTREWLAVEGTGEQRVP